MKKLLHIFEKIIGIYRWHPTIALRYLPIIDELKSKNLLDSDILEVGSGGLGIAPYLNRKIVGVDLEFSPPIADNLISVKASALNLPFVNNSFATVISTDMLEHLSLIDRKQAIREMLRVANKFVSIAVPCGAQSLNQDKQLAALYKKTHRKEFDFFSEHVEFGLPTQEELKKTIEKSAYLLGKKIIISEKSTLNLKLRYMLMRGWISENFLINIFFRKVLLVFIPVLRLFNQPPTYRHIFFVTIIL